MRGTVLRDFHYSHDGIRSERLLAGDEHVFRPELFDGLVRDGLIKAPKVEKSRKGSPEPAPVSTKEVEGDNPPSKPETPTSDAPAGEGSEEVVTDPLDTLAALEEVEDAGDENPLVVRHVSRGKYDVFRGSVRITNDLTTKEEAEAKRAALAGA